MMGPKVAIRCGNRTAVAVSSRVKTKRTRLSCMYALVKSRIEGTSSSRASPTIQMTSRSRLRAAPT